MKRKLGVLFGGLLLVAAMLVAFGSSSAVASTFTVSPWAYACGTTTFGNPVSKADTPGANGCPAGDVFGTASASYTGGYLTLTKTCLGEIVDAAKCTADDLSSGATIGGLVTLTSASWDLTANSYCGAGAPRLNVVTADDQIHFFGCAANRSGNHVSLNLSAAGDGAGNGGVLGKSVKSINIVMDETGETTLFNLSFSGTAAPAPSPSPSPVGCVPGGTVSPARVACPSPVPTTSPATATTTTTTTAPLPPTTGIGEQG